MSVLEEAGWLERSHWVHTAGIDSLRKQKSDRLDTQRWVKKLAVHDVDPLPEAWFPPAPSRQLRLLARHALWHCAAAGADEKPRPKPAGDARSAYTANRAE